MAEYLGYFWGLESETLQININIWKNPIFLLVKIISDSLTK